LKGGYKVINQEVDNNMPLIDWADDNTLGIIHAKRGALTLTLFDYGTKSKLPRKLRRFDQVKSMDFSDNGRLIIVSGVVNGKNDLFLLSSRRDRVKRLTDDLYDDMYASFVPGTNSFVFSSNRTSDTLAVKTNDFENLGKTMNLFIYNLDTTKTVLKRVTNTISHDTKPLALNRDIVYYLSDQKGVSNLFKYSLSSGIYTQVTNYRQSIKNFDIDFTNNALAFISTQIGQDQIYYANDFNYNQQIFTPTTPRQQVLQVKAFRERRKPKANALTIQDIVEQRLSEKNKEAKRDTVQTDTTEVSDPEVIDTDNYQFEEDVTVAPDEDVINTDDYTFDNDLVKPQQESFLTQYRQLRKENKITGPLKYEERFSADNIITSFVIDPLRGFGILLETQMTDMLENHKFSGGVTAITDLSSGDIWAEYQYLKGRVDLRGRLERNVLEWDPNGRENQQYSKNTITLGASLPINTKARFSVNPFYTYTTFESQPLALGSSPQFDEVSNNQFAGAHLEFVYDNSIINGMNLIEGSRAKISLRHYEGLKDKEESFTNFKADLRHYQKIHREIVFATRLFYGSFFGRAPKNYLLGGMDNWINQDDNLEGTANPLAPIEQVGVDNSELLFTEFATNVRGFDYASLVGNNTVVFNAELRVPLIRYLQAGPITSNFFRNLQFTGFFDIGSAWTGASPFNEDNSISNRIIRDGAFVIDLKNFRNPWLYSYGFGFRTMLLGYYVKVDVAYPVENFNVGDTAFHFTLGYDF
ncbi:MAG: translocation protein TolB, partial [Bacteroidota bacterium]